MGLPVSSVELIREDGGRGRHELTPGHYCPPDG